jgi:hypothetical protein
VTAPHSHRPRAFHPATPNRIVLTVRSFPLPRSQVHPQAEGVESYALGRTRRRRRRGMRRVWGEAQKCASARSERAHAGKAVVRVGLPTQWVNGRMGERTVWDSTVSRVKERWGFRNVVRKCEHRAIVFIVLVRLFKQTTKIVGTQGHIHTKIHAFASLARSFRPLGSLSPYLTLSLSSSLSLSRAITRCARDQWGCLGWRGACGTGARRRPRWWWM